MATNGLSFEVCCGLVLEALTNRQAGQYAELREDVIGIAASRNLLSLGARAPTLFESLSRHQQTVIAEMVRQALWTFLVRGILVFGKDESNANWPFYQLTPVGHRAVKERNPQPYDPNGFLDYFREQVPSADPVVMAYVSEAVHTFNAACFRASAVMLGAASEKLILLLIEALGTSISVAARKQEYEVALRKNWVISHRYKVFKDTFDKIVAAKASSVSPEIQQALRGEIAAGFELLRRVRNDAGHPTNPGDPDENGLFMNLRFFPEYAKRVGIVLAFLETSQLTW